MVQDFNDFLGGAETLVDFLSFLARCHDGGVYLNLSKFNIALEGHSLIFKRAQISSKGYLMNPAQRDAIRKFQRPQTSNFFCQSQRR